MAVILSQGKALQQDQEYISHENLNNKTNTNLIAEHITMDTSLIAEHIT
jgi:hypothetical protein